MSVAVVPEVRLTMPARAEGVGVVRQALAGMADALAYDAAIVADMKMAVTEACTNVVVHAYDAAAARKRLLQAFPQRRCRVDVVLALNDHDHHVVGRFVEDDRIRIHCGTQSTQTGRRP